jgi:hypothetical protein
MVRFQNIGFGWWRLSRRRKNGITDTLEINAGGLGAFRAAVIVLKTCIHWVLIGW